MSKNKKQSNKNYTTGSAKLNADIYRKAKVYKLDCLPVEKLIELDEVTALEVIRKNPMQLQYMNATIQDTKSIVLEAVKLNPASLCFASDAIKRNREYNIEILEHNIKAVKYMKELLADSSFMLSALAKFDNLLEELPSETFDNIFCMTILDAKGYDVRKYMKPHIIYEMDRAIKQDNSLKGTFSKRERLSNTTGRLYEVGGNDKNNDSHEGNHNEDSYDEDNYNISDDYMNAFKEAMKSKQETDKNTQLEGKFEKMDEDELIAWSEKLK